MFIELYHAHSIADDGGMHWRQIRQSYERKKIAERGRWTIWGFTRGTDLTWAGKPFAAAFWTDEKDADGRDTGATDFWAAWEAFKRRGLVEEVPHLVEDDTDQAGIIHPCPSDTGADVEQALGAAARRAAIEILDKYPFSVSSLGGCRYLLPVPDDYPKAELMGIYRLRYRPKTAMTAAWFSKMSDYAAMAADFNALADEAQGRATAA
jgi:hypothetical protein